VVVARASRVRAGARRAGAAVHGHAFGCERHTGAQFERRSSAHHERSASRRCQRSSAGQAGASLARDPSRRHRPCRWLVAGSEARELPLVRGCSQDAWLQGHMRVSLVGAIDRSGTARCHGFARRLRLRRASPPPLALTAAVILEHDTKDRAIAAAHAQRATGQLGTGTGTQERPSKTVTGSDFEFARHHRCFADRTQER
jgi:hypothetical protein